MSPTASQQAAIDHRDGNLLLAASAGSGKTEVLAQRCYALLADRRRPCDVTRLLVVTFTRAAAAELRVRVAKMLRAGVAREKDPALRSHLLRQEALVPAAEIGTIDSWCQRVVRENFAAAGVDARFTVLSEPEAALLRGQQMDALFEWVFASDDPDAARARAWLQRHSRASADFLRGFVSQLNRFREVLVDPDAWFARQRATLTDGDPAARARRVLAETVREECAFQARELAELAPGAAAAELSRYAAALAAWQAALADDAQLLAVAAQIGEFKFDTKVAPGARAIAEGWHRKRLKERFDAEYLSGLIATAPRATEYMQTLLTLEQRYETQLRAAKSSRAVCEFADVLRLALDLLGRPTAGPRRAATPLALQLQQRYEHLLIDEYQDTSPVQVEILRLVTRAGQGGGNRFCVGDVKQSIYGFRQAEPRLFAEMLAAFADGSEPGSVRYLADNFRSHEALLAGLNDLFAALFEPGFGGAEFGPGERLRARRADVDNPSLGDAARIEIWVVDDPPAPDEGDATDSESGDADDERERVEREADAVAAEIRRLFAASVQTPERAADGAVRLRDLRYDDVVILLRAAAGNAGLVAGRLRAAGLPCVASGRDALLDTVEALDVRSVLALLANRRQDLPLAAYLRGPFANLTPDDLLRIRACAGGPFHIAAGVFEAEGAGVTHARLRAALEQLDRWRVVARERDLPTLLQHILRESGYVHFVRGLPGGRHRVAILRALERLAQEFAAGGQGGAAEFVAWLDELDTRDAAPNNTAVGGENAIRIMTIHAAKGLEFPVVFVLNTGAKFNDQSANASLQCDPDAGLGLKFADYRAGIDIESACRPGIRGRTQRRGREEELRLLYVAATRAKEKLYIVGHRGHIKPEALPDAAAPPAARPTLLQKLTAPSMLAWVLMAAGAAGLTAPRKGGPPLARLSSVSSGPVDPVLAPAAPAETPPTPLSGGEEQWARECARRVALGLDRRLAELPAVLSVSAVKELARRDADADQPALLDSSPPGLARPGFVAASAVDGRALGTATHRFLQAADLARLATSADVRAQLAALVRSGALSSEDAALVPVDSIAWFGASPTGAFVARRADAVARETPFVYAFELPHAGESVIVRGVIDLLIRAPQLVLLDYKTDRIADAAALERRTRDYTPQLQVYATAAAAIFGRPVAQMLLVFLDARQIVTLAPAPVPLEAWLRAARAPQPA